MFNEEELKLIQGCLLTTKETFKLVPFKTEDIKTKIIQIEELLQKMLKK